MADQATYYFGRLNLMATYDDRRLFLMKGLHSREPSEVRRIRWAFFDVGEISGSDGVFAYGFLAKYRAVTDEEVAREDIGAIADTPISNLIVAKSRFFIHLDTGIIAFHGVQGQIDVDLFCNRFKRVFEHAYGRLFVAADIDMMQEEYKLLEVLSQFSSVTKLRLWLHPCHGEQREQWKDIDDELRRKGADNYSESLEAGRQSISLRIQMDKNLIAKIAMAQDGYGRAQVKGRLQGRIKTVSSSDNPVNASVPNNDRTLEELLASLNPTFFHLFSRFSAQPRQQQIPVSPTA